MKLNLLVLKSHNIHALKNQYEALGLIFDYHQHGEKSPWHYSTDIDGLIFEIYPLSPKKEVDNSTRLGFEVENIEQTIEKMLIQNWVIKNPLKTTSYGTVAVLQDMEGRKIEIKNTVTFE